MNKPYGTWEPIQIIRSHSGLARWYATMTYMPVGYLTRQVEIPSPYADADSGSHAVYSSRISYKDLFFVVETAHKRFEVFKLTTPSAMSDQETADERYYSFLRSQRAAQ